MTADPPVLSSAAEPSQELGNSDDWVQLVRNDFPALAQTVHGRRLIYLDNAATTQKPHQVIAALGCAYAKECADLWRGPRGGHALSQLATERFEAVRDKVRRFIAAPSTREVIFTSGTTESINLLAHTLGRSRLTAGDEVVVSGLEHDSNLVPWQLLCAERGARLRLIPLNPLGEVEVAAVAGVLSARTRIVAISHAGNVLGTVVPVAEIAELAHAHGALLAVDGAQAVPHLRIDVSALGCDFYSFSGHKLYGPTGVGVLWGRASLLEQLPPWQSGGATVLAVSAEGAVFRDIPYKFEAGTPPIAAVIGLGAALDYIQDCGRATIAEHEAFLYAHGVRVLSALSADCGLRLLGSAAPAVPILSFTVDGVPPAELASDLDLEGIAVQAGHHHAQPLLAHLGLTATVRVSLACYNTIAELDALAAAIKQIVHRRTGR
jgi:cysteine desulfurase/selenocysteine lyase